MTGHHHHHAPQRVHTENVVLDIGDDLGGLVFYATGDLHGQEIEVLAQEAGSHKIHCEVEERIVNGRTIFTGVFPPVPAGDYQICRPAPRAGERFTVTAGYVKEIDWTLQALGHIEGAGGPQDGVASGYDRAVACLDVVPNARRGLRGSA